MTEDQKLSRQALYNRRKRLESGGAVNVVPRDKAALDVAVEESGISQAEWLRDAIDEKIDREIPELKSWRATSGGNRRSPMFEFFAAFGLIKTKKIAKDLAGLLAMTDKDAAGQADLAVKEKTLDAAGRLLMELRQSHAHEVEEFEKLDRLYKQYLAAAEKLQARAQDAATPAADKGQIDAGLGELVDKLEKMAPELEQHRRDVEDSAALLKEATEAYEEKAADLKTAKSQLDEAQRTLARAQIDSQRAKEQAEKAARVAGLRSDDQAGGVNVALTAMNEQAAKLRANAEANRLKAQVLAKTPAAPGNQFVAEALAEAADVKPAQSVSDRLAALRK
jgi:DNA repair exonuclease SbcCD ATPase subunit